MENNVGNIDRMIRYIVAIVLIVVAAIGQGNFFWLLIPAIILGFTAATSWCALYKLIGVNTCKADTDDK